MTDNGSRVAIVTGGSGGIGQAITARLARDGFSVAVHYVGNAGKSEDIAQSIKNTGGQAVAVAADVTDPAQVERAFAQATAAFGRLDVVVHTAGIMPLGPIVGGDLALFDKVIATNLRGTYSC